MVSLETFLLQTLFRTHGAFKMFRLCLCYLKIQLESLLFVIEVWQGFVRLEVMVEDLDVAEFVVLRG